MAGYFFGFLGLAGGCGSGGSGLAFGRPILILANISMTDLSYSASLVIGLILAVSIRFLTASMDIFSSFAISDTVMPSILLYRLYFKYPLISIYYYTNIKEKKKY